MDEEENLPPPPPVVPPGVVPEKSDEVIPGPPVRRTSPGESTSVQQHYGVPAVSRKLVFPQMHRKGFGSRGEPTQLLCNHYKVKFQPKKDVVHYNVTIEPAVPKAVSRKVMEKLFQTFGQVELGGKRFAYDGEKSLFTVGGFHSGSRNIELTVMLDDDRRRGPRRGNIESGPHGLDEGSAKRAKLSSTGRDFNVKIEFAATVDMSVIGAVLDGRYVENAQDALRVLDIVLREHAVNKSYMLLRDNFYHSSLGPVNDLGEGVQSWRGYHCSFRPTLSGLSLNFDLSTTIVLKPGYLAAFLEEFVRKSIHDFRYEDWIKAKRILKGVRVEVYNGRVHKIIGFSPETCDKQTYTVLADQQIVKKDNGDVDTVEITVAEYYEKDRNMPLRWPSLPAVDVGKSNKPMYFPFELCNIVPGQSYKKKLTGGQIKKHLDQARQGPDERKQIVQNALTANQYNSNELVREFGVEIMERMSEIKGRVLEAPDVGIADQFLNFDYIHTSLKFGKNHQEKPKNGRWNFNNKVMQTPMKIQKWAVANFSTMTDQAAHGIARDLQSCCAKKGMEMADPCAIIREDRSMQNCSPEERVNKMVFGQLAKFKPDFVLAILPQAKNCELYAPFKRICEVKIQVLSQCIAPPRQVKDQYLTNVALKINLKWGGYNSILLQEERRQLPKIHQVATVVFGMDVSHGSPGDATSPSIAAAVASVNWPHVSQYATRVRSQAPKTEMIEGLYEEIDGKPGGMVMELLTEFFRTCQGPPNQRKPQQILIYRDGVSESQFEQVLEKELRAFKKGCTALEIGYNPKITLVVVQKRHHTRFFPARSGGNVSPGTIVDNTVCHPRDNDFYLCSHAGLIGTTRPTHYHVLYDEIGFTADELQHVTNSLCYTYTRCTTAVSVAAPAYYAHLAATHCRNFLDNENSGSESSSMMAVARQIQALPPLKGKMLQRMFYC